MIDSLSIKFILEVFFHTITESLDHVSVGDSSSFLNSAKLGHPSTSPSLKHSLSPQPPSVDDIDDTMAHLCDIDVDLTNIQLLTRSVEACKVKMQLHRCGDIIQLTNIQHNVLHSIRKHHKLININILYCMCLNIAH